MNREPHELAEQLKDYLRGMARGRADRLEQLSAYEEWERLARREIERRATSLVEILDDDMLTAIAGGEINVAAAIREVLAEPRE